MKENDGARQGKGSWKEKWLHLLGNSETISPLAGIISNQQDNIRFCMLTKVFDSIIFILF
jgi:hypothetical protein